MKRLYTIAMLAATAVSAGAADPDGMGHYKATFTGSNDNYTCNQTGTGSEITVANGHLNVTLSEQTNGKWRGDIKVENTGGTVNTTDDCILAVKFIGTYPAGCTFKTELKLSNTWIAYSGTNNQWPFSSSTITTTSGNSIYYIDFSAKESFTGLEGDQTLDQIHIIMADLVLAEDTDYTPDYTIDWIATFSSVEALTAAKDWQDDGEYDADEQEVVLPDFCNTTTDVYYSTLNEAISAAAADGYIVLSGDGYITERQIKNIKNLTITSDDDATMRTVTRSAYNKEHFTLGVEGSNGYHTYSNLRFCNDEEKLNIYYFNVKSGCSITLDNVVMDGVFSYNADAQKGSIVNVNSGATLNVNNVSWTDCWVTGGAYIYAGGTVNITGDCGGTSLYLTSTGAINYDGNAAVDEPLTLVVADESLLGATVVNGTTDTTLFTCSPTTYTMQANDDATGLILVESVQTGIATVKTATVESVEYYTLQGVHVSNPEKGVYVKVTDGKAVKVIL